MSFKFQLLTLFLIIGLILLKYTCNNKNHIDQYNVDINELKKLPNNFYAYWRGGIYVSDLNENYRLEFDLNNQGNVGDLKNISNLKNQTITQDSTIALYNIDTLKKKNDLQHFVNLSKKYLMGHAYIEKEKLIYFSYHKDVRQQYVMPLNDSLKMIYSNDESFQLLENDWYEYLD